jgi:hypothetical protein
VAGDEQRGEEGNALDVVPVRVADQHMTVNRPLARAEQVLAQLVDAGAAVDHQQGAGIGFDADAGGIAAVAHRARTGFGQRAAGSPETYFHWQRTS